MSPWEGQAGSTAAVECPEHCEHSGAQLVRKEQILIAEDDAYTAQDLKYRLESLHYEVRGITARAQEAVTLAESLRPDLVLMDIQLLGEMDGIEAAEQIRIFQVPVVYVSGYCDGPILNRAKLTEPYGYILKPYDTSHLQVSIEMGLYKHRLEQQRLEQFKGVQETLANVKTLRGRLSICCYCKQIHEETGNWIQIEAYIMKHSDASFTHGMCPECFERVKRQLEATEQGTGDSGLVVLG